MAMHMHMSYAYGICIWHIFDFGEFEGRSPSRTSGGGVWGGRAKPSPPGALEVQAGGTRELWGRWNTCQRPEKEVAEVAKLVQKMKKSG